MEIDVDGSAILFQGHGNTSPGRVRGALVALCEEVQQSDIAARRLKKQLNLNQRKSQAQRSRETLENGNDQQL